ncbi:MAG: hypothetical protein KC776_34235 [Myxococcales bacterium]|nr:hypothetical protein [Myxococcales bacterium]MCB9583549.1 hypothetical protein [Polyangiaceae bacterium]
MTKRHLVVVVFLGLTACGAGQAPGTTPKRESGQSGLMGETFAGKNKCNPENHERPFVIEWDATDMSSFESLAQRDVVVVQYEGCKLRILDGCRDDAIPGAYSAYRPVSWTAGSLERVEIGSEADLYAKLPLGVGELSGRVAGGEKFRMEYFVAGTRNATRPGLYQGDIQKNPACQGATHFVYGYNLGAFALGSTSESSLSAGGSLYGFGAGGEQKRHDSAEKHGGDLASCTSDAAHEIASCKVPIRLTLRPIEPGDNPDHAAQRAPDTDSSLNAAGKVAETVEMSAEAKDRYLAAQAKLRAGDGKSCLAELDKHDALDPKHPSTEASSGLDLERPKCLMLAGQCDAGRQLARKYVEQRGPGKYSNDDDAVDALVGEFCRGKMAPRDQLLVALHTIVEGYVKGGASAKECEQSYFTAKKLLKTIKNVPAHGAEDGIHHWAAICAARAKDCKTAYKLFKDGFKPTPAYESLKTPAAREGYIRSGFKNGIGSVAGQCGD